MLPAAHTLIRSALNRLFESEERRLNEILVRLNQDHRELSKVTVDGFIYMGKRYVPIMSTLTLPASGAPVLVLHMDLHPRMEAYLSDKDQIFRDRSDITLALCNALQDCSTGQHLRDVVPECLVPFFFDQVKLDRRQEPGWTLDPGSRGHRQFHQAVPKMEMYAAGRLLY